MTRKATMRYNQHDEGYSWIILGCVFLVTFFHLGSTKVFGVFVPYIVEQLDMSTWGIGLACGIGVGLKFVLGIGYGLPVVAKVVVLKDYFDTKFSLANGIAFTGGAVGMIVSAPLMELLIETYGWRGAMLIFGAMNLNISAAGALMVQPDYGSGRSSEVDNVGKVEMSPLKKNQATNFKWVCSKSAETVITYLGLPELKRYRILSVYLCAMGFHDMVLNGWALFLVSYTVKSGYSVQIASILSAIGGGGAFIGRLILGPFVDKGLVSGRMMFTLLAVGGTISMCCFPVTGLYLILTVLSFVAGFMLASATPIFVVMIRDITQDDSVGFASAVGLHYMARGVGTILAGPITGWIYDMTGSFYAAFLTLALLEAAAAVMTLAKPGLLNQCTRK